MASVCHLISAVLAAPRVLAASRWIWTVGTGWTADDELALFNPDKRNIPPQALSSVRLPLSSFQRPHHTAPLSLSYVWCRYSRLTHTFPYDPLYNAPLCETPISFSKSKQCMAHAACACSRNKRRLTITPHEGCSSKWRKRG